MRKITALALSLALIFVSAVAPASAQNSNQPDNSILLRFVQITDTHLGEESLIEHPKEDLLALKTQLLSLDPKPAFVIHTGDVVDCGEDEEQYQELYSVFSGGPGNWYLDTECEVPVYFCPGNHDYTSQNTLANYNRYICSENDYVFTWGKVVVFMINSGPNVPSLSDPMIRGTGLTGEQISWLEERLDLLDGVRNRRDDSNYYKVIGMHHPTISPLDYGVFINNREEFIELCKAYNVDAVLSGHVHAGQMFDRWGNRWGEGSIGPLFANCSSLRTLRGYRVVDIKPDGIYVDGIKIERKIEQSPIGKPRAAVTDVDGTIAEVVGLGPMPPYPDAARDLSVLASQGYTIIYLSAKGSFFQQAQVDWLKQNGFPDGVVICVEPSLFPTADKLRELRQLIGTYYIEYGFGNRDTDMHAYEAAGIPKIYRVTDSSWWQREFNPAPPAPPPQNGGETGGAGGGGQPSEPRNFLAGLLDKLLPALNRIIADALARLIQAFRIPLPR